MFFKLVLIFVWATMSASEMVIDSVIELKEGKNGLIKCKSNEDDSHIFMFWHLPKTLAVIGPRNEYNNRKYDYDAISGSLELKYVSKSDEGIYSCVSEGISKQDIIIKNTRVEVLSSDFVQSLYQENLVIIVTVMAVVLAILLVLFIGIIIRKKMRHSKMDFKSSNEFSSVYCPTTTKEENLLAKSPKILPESIEMPEEERRILRTEPNAIMVV